MSQPVMDRGNCATVAIQRDHGCRIGPRTLNPRDPVGVVICASFQIRPDVADEDPPGRPRLAVRSEQGGPQYRLRSAGPGIMACAFAMLY